MEHVSVLTGQAAAAHGEMAGATVSITGHGLVDHDCVQEGGVSVAPGIVG